MTLNAARRFGLTKYIERADIIDAIYTVDKSSLLPPLAASASQAPSSSSGESTDFIYEESSLISMSSCSILSRTGYTVGVQWNSTIDDGSSCAFWRTPRWNSSGGKLRCAWSTWRTAFQRRDDRCCSSRRFACRSCCRRRSHGTAEDAQEGSFTSFVYFVRVLIGTLRDSSRDESTSSHRLPPTTKIPTAWISRLNLLKSSLPTRRRQLLERTLVLQVRTMTMIWILLKSVSSLAALRRRN